MIPPEESAVITIISPARLTSIIPSPLSSLNLATPKVVSLKILASPVPIFSKLKIPVLDSKLSKTFNDIGREINQLSKTKFSKTSGDFYLGKVEIIPRDIRKIIDHFRYMKWIKKIHHDEPVEYFQLTDLGRKAYLENQAFAFLHCR